MFPMSGIREVVYKYGSYLCNARFEQSEGRLTVYRPLEMEPEGRVATSPTMLTKKAAVHSKPEPNERFVSSRGEPFRVAAAQQMHDTEWYGAAIVPEGYIVEKRRALSDFPASFWEMAR